MKKIILSFFVFILGLSVYAQSFPDIKFKNINNKDKIYYDSASDNWTKDFNKKTDNYFIKTKGFGDFYDYLYPNKDFAFSTNCEYEFLYNGSLIGYSNRDLKFYDIKFINDGLNKRELTKEEVQKILPDYHIIYLSEFSKKTNSYKIKKYFGSLKVLLLNDTDNTYDNFYFSSGNASFHTYALRGFITITKPGMIQFTKNDSHINSEDWYVLLVR